MSFVRNPLTFPTKIAGYSISPANAYITFKNGSTVKVVYSRIVLVLLRANWVICDEFVRIKKSVIDEVLRNSKLVFVLLDIRSFPSIRIIQRK